MKEHTRNSGFTLVETLVSMVVISVGMLGIAAMYVEGLRAGKSSIYRTEAVSLVSDMADRIRANPTAVAAYGGAGANNNCVNGPVDCTPAQLAADDIFRWQQDVAARIPGGISAIQVTAGVPVNTYTITLRWADAGTTTLSSYAISMQL
jgi:type IV pilus assembly protein PilV